MSETPLISIIISNYNYGQYLKAAINSALQQTYSHCEVIVVDDGSTDGSRELIATYGNQIISVFKQNGGLSSAFNSGFSASHGEIVCFLDADDVFELDKLEKIASLWSAHPEIGWCFHSLELIDTTTGRFIGTTRAFPHQPEEDSCCCDFRESLQQGRINFYSPATSGICVERSLLSRVVPIPEGLRAAGDRYIANALMLLSPGYFLKNSLTRQGIHDNNDFTMKPGVRGQQNIGRNAISAAYYLRDNFPFAWKFSHRTFARGWGFARRYGFASEESRRIHHKYLKSVSWVEKLVIFLISWYQNRPWKKSGLYRFNLTDLSKASSGQ